MSQYQEIEYSDYYDEETFGRIRTFAADKETPFVVIDSSTVGRAYDDMARFFPFADIFYAVKANPAPAILSLLAELGSSFDIASIYELDMVLSHGVTPDRISFGNTIKKRAHVKRFYQEGVRMFASDSEADLRMLAQEAPGSRVYVRILTEGSRTADWALSRKFGCQTEMAYDLLVLARELGLVPYGLSFHVGSQQRDIGAWDAAIGKVKIIFDRLLEEDGIRLQMINLGGGFPANYIDPTNDLEVYVEEITRFLREDFGDDLPRIILFIFSLFSLNFFSIFRIIFCMF